jgi:hypothetical protein
MEHYSISIGVDGDSAHSIKIEKGKEMREEEEERRREGQSTFEGCSEPLAS